jgi:hypothetical protein
MGGIKNLEFLMVHDSSAITRSQFAFAFPHAW